MLLVAVAVLVAIDAGPGDDADPHPAGDGPEARGPAAVAPTPDRPTPQGSGVDTPSASSDSGPALLQASADAASVSPAVLLDVADRAARGPWRHLLARGWAPEPRPVVVATVDLMPDEVAADVTFAWRAVAPTDEVVLRFLPAATAAVHGGADVAVTQGDRGLSARVDADGARIVVRLPARAEAGAPVGLRVRLRYPLPPIEALPAAAEPAAFGLLGQTRSGATLGHWLPALTLPGEDGPMVAWGDVGGFPVAMWSVITQHDGTLVTGGVDESCPTAWREPQRSCTWSRGVALRDVSAVQFDDAPDRRTGTAGGLDVASFTPVGAFAAASQRTALAEAVASAESFTARFGPLAWPDLDMVAAPLRGGTAGMEFPGLVLVDTQLFDHLDGGIGTAVIAHEVAHQWFHALVGNGSLSSPVVDESLAQYLSMLFWRDAFGDEAAGRYAEAAFLRRYEQARAEGPLDGRPAQPLRAFEPSSYGPLVYGRAPLAWVAAEDALGVAAVETFLADLVAEYGLDRLSDDELLAVAEAAAPRLGAILERWWFTDELPPPATRAGR